MHAWPRLGSWRFLVCLHCAIVDSHAFTVVAMLTSVHGWNLLMVELVADTLWI